MMKKLYTAAMMMAAVLPVAAQDTYESARLLGSDLNGTARYVGMGGAMEALGADISTISTNPAAIGLFRHSTASVSFGFVSQQDVQKFDGKDKTVMSFDQAGFVYSARLNRASFVNFAFNYHKSRNFNQIISAANALSGCSQNDLTYYKADKGIYELDFNKQGEAIGYVGNDRFYWGLTVGLKDVNYRGYSEYGESLLASGQSCGSAVYGDERKIKGTGLEVIAGIIVRPIEDSPFRIGVSVATPTWYDLTTNNETLLLNKTKYGSWDDGHSHTDYDFKLYTPWKFGLSVGHTIGTQVALGASYEYSDFSTASNRVNKGDRYWYGDYGYSPSYIDEPMKKNTEKSLKGVHTLKAGVEFKPVPEMAVRFGYNYVSSPYEKNGMRDMTIDSPGVSYSSTTDYVNWQDTHRITCGLGYKVSGVNIDLAYQYNTTNGDFHPFQPYAGNSGVKEVSNKRHQVLLTLGYTF